MTKKASLKSNFVLQGLYQILLLGIPLIISPYLTRILGADNLGLYTYSSSIAYYFVIFANLGISRHGQRVIASVADDDLELRKQFWSLFSIHVLLSVVATVAYILYVLFIVSDNKLIFYMQTAYVLSALFDITWFFYGLENFRSVILKNTLVKVANLVLVFAFVKSEQDLLQYTIIMAGSLLAGQIIMVPQAVKIAKPIHFNLKDMIPHIKPLIILSISVIAVSLYTVFDKTLIGMLVDMKTVSFYEYADKIIIVPKSLLGVVSTVLFPRICKLAESGEHKKLGQYFDTSFTLIAVLGFFATSVLAGVSTTFSPLYYGASFSECGRIMMCLAPVIVIVALGDLIRTQLMISRYKDKQFIFCVVINSVVNLIISCSLIRTLGPYGAVLGTLSAELCGLVLETYICRGDFDVKRTYLRTVPFLIIGAFTCLIIYVIHNAMGTTWISLFVQVLVGSLLYFVVAIAYMYLWRKDFLINIKSILKSDK